MKHFLSLILLFSSLSIFAQTEVDSSTKPNTPDFTSVDKIPKAPDCGVEATKENQSCVQRYILSHVAKNFKFPTEAQKRGVQGRMYIYFVVEKDGSVSNVEAVKSIASKYWFFNSKRKRAAKELDNEGIRVVKLLKFEEPAFLKDKPVRMSFTLPINAVLQ